MTELKRVVIVGVGLLGGSIGLGLRKRKLAEEIIGVGRTSESLEQAVALGAIDHFSLDLEYSAADADAVIVCTPVQSVAEHALRALPLLASSGWVTDVGSTKLHICQKLDTATAGPFCGSHPLAGSDRSGVQFADPELFNGRLTILTPTEFTQPETLERTRRLWETLGSRTQVMTPADHDEAIAKTSHLPHVIAACLAAHTKPEHLPLTATGWADTTRVAAGNVEMWQQIISDNRSAILESLRDFRGSLDEWIDTIDAADDHNLVKLLENAKHNRTVTS